MNPSRCSVCGHPTVDGVRLCTVHRPRFDNRTPAAAEREAEDRLLLEEAEALAELIEAEREGRLE